MMAVITQMSSLSHRPPIFLTRFLSCSYLERQMFVLSETGSRLNPYCVTNMGYCITERAWNPLGVSTGVFNETEKCIRSGATEL